MEKHFKCTFCHHQFRYEDRYLKHRCKIMIRTKELETVEGQAGWFFYQTWMRNKHRQIPQLKSFLHSKFYGPFLRFAQFAKQVRIPDPDLYIAQMVYLDMQPVLWTNDQVYANFLEYMDKKVLPSKHVQITINTLFDIADDLNCEVSDVFNYITPNDLIQMMRQRKLSPWILLHSEKFKKFFLTLSQQHKIILETIIRPVYWAEKLKNHPDLVQDMKKYVQELSI
jgi:hypothetical protein